MKKLLDLFIFKCLKHKMKISIVTTMYNVESFIKDCVDSLINQSYKDLEIILVNDCSTDKTMEIVNEYEDDRIVIINNLENLGAGYSRKVGIEHATGEYIITVDGDDWLSLDFIEKLVENAKETKADIVSGGITYVFSDEYEEIHKFKPTISTGFKKFLDYGDRKIVFLNNKLVKRSMYDTVPYNTRRYCEDTPVILPLLYYANAVSYVDTLGYFYRQHPNSLCRRVDCFEESLYKALCCKDLINFFSDKGVEYQNLFSKTEFVQYIKNLKTYGDDEHYIRYEQALGELMPAILELINF